MPSPPTATRHWRAPTGALYRARDTMLDRKVAAKVLSGPALSAEGRARLLRESQAAFEEMDGQRYVAVARDQLQELGATEEPDNPAP